MWSVVFYLCLCIITKITIALDCDVPGYYWRDFTGTIPQDAVPGGVNSQGKQTYMGQAKYLDYVAAVKIDLSAERKITLEHGWVEHDVQNNIKILCGQDHDAFEWVPTDNNEFHKIKDKHFIAVYNSGSTNVYIGRKLIDDELVIGKVNAGDVNASIHTTKDGKGYAYHDNFQVLAYSPKEKKPTPVMDSSSEFAPVAQLKSIYISIYN